MTGRMVPWILGALIAGAAACGGRDEPAEVGEPDTLEIDLPVGEIEDRLEEGARRIGGRVGEALEQTGEAIERAGERIQDETVEPDTTEPDTLVP